MDLSPSEVLSDPLCASRWIGGSPTFWEAPCINIGGCFVIGLCTALFAGTSAASTPIEIRQFVLVGVCGGFTTFSSFSLQTLNLFNANEPGRALLNVMLSLTLCLIAVAAGYVLPGALTTVSRGVGP